MLWSVGGPLAPGKGTKQQKVSGIPWWHTLLSGSPFFPKSNILTVESFIGQRVDLAQPMHPLLVRALLSVTSVPSPCYTSSSSQAISTVKLCNPEICFAAFMQIDHTHLFHTWPLLLPSHGLQSSSLLSAVAGCSFFLFTGQMNRFHESGLRLSWALPHSFFWRIFYVTWYCPHLVITDQDLSFSDMVLSMYSHGIIWDFHLFSPLSWWPFCLVYNSFTLLVKVTPPWCAHAH